MPQITKLWAKDILSQIWKKEGQDQDTTSLADADNPGILWLMAWPLQLTPFSQAKFPLCLCGITCLIHSLLRAYTNLT